MDLRLNAMRRIINLSVYFVFDLEAGQFKFLGENLLGAGTVKRELSTRLPLTTCRNAKPTKSLKFAILNRKSFVTSKQFK